MAVSVRSRLHLRIRAQMNVKLKVALYNSLPDHFSGIAISI